MPKPFSPRVVESQRNRRKLRECSERFFRRGEVVAADPIHSGAGCVSPQSAQTIPSCGPSPFSVSGGKERNEARLQKLGLVKA